MKLTPDQLDLLSYCAESAGLEVRTDHSGRGMYGKTCVGVTGTVRGLLEMIVSITDDDRELAEHLTEVSTDSMGLSTIYYWTKITVKDET